MSGAIAFGTATAIADGSRNLAIALGDEASASAAGGDNNLAIAIGNPDNIPDVADPGLGPTNFAPAVVRRPTRADAGVPRLFALQSAAAGLASASSDNNVAISMQRHSHTSWVWQ